MSANTILFNDPGRAREQRFDVWWEDGASPTLPAWLSTTSGSTVGSPPANWSTDAVGMQNGQGYMRLVAGAAAANASESRITTTNTMSFGARSLELNVGGLLYSENDADPDAASFTSQFDYFMMLASTDFGVWLEHTAAVGYTVLRIREFAVNRSVRPGFLELIKNDNGGKPKNIGLRTRQVARDTWVAEVLINGQVAFQEPLTWNNAAGFVNNARASFGMRKVAGSTERWLRFESVSLKVQR